MMVSAWRAISCGRCSQLPWTHGVCTWPAINEPHEGKRRAEALWPIHQINNQRSCVAWARCKQRPVLHVADCLPAALLPQPLCLRHVLPLQEDFKGVVSVLP